ncbi:MAG: fused MFS/spermidine synthase [Acidobacteria bacterium]|nr:fused MFS/spermidine synthase [Acidobacteriota bacterium]
MSVWLFAGTLFLSAALLFTVQPMFARLVLPYLGGAPSVWTTCVLFYQSALLGGYLYAHLLVERLRLRRQVLVHLALILVVLLILPPAIPEGWTPPTAASPVPALLGLLAMTIGVPFFAISSTAPLLQRWFASTAHQASGDPYFLYAASNAGSLLALVAYPVAIDPAFGLAAQTRLWSVGVASLALLVAACAWMVFRGGALVAVSEVAPEGDGGGEPGGPVRWTLLALVPSSLMLSVTTYMTTDIAAIPLLWVVPLGLYLLTFIIAFGRRRRVSDRVMAWLLPLAVLAPMASVLANATRPAWIWIPLHLVGLFVAGLACHQRLAASRPAPSRLTGFYLWLSFGGALGGVLNVVVAPWIFSLPTEYPLGLVAACLLASPAAPRRLADLRRRDVVWPVVLGAVALALFGVTRATAQPMDTFAGIALVFAPPLVLCVLWWPWPVRFAGGLAVLLLVGGAVDRLEGRVLATERNFFGVQRVLDDSASEYRLLMHGSTIHGVQALAPERRREPLSYFTRSGPVGQVFETLLGENGHARVAVLGLGGGTLACYARPGHEWTFFEIDAAVVRLARDEGHFTYLRECAPSAQVLLGDARLTLARLAPEVRYDLIVFDAFSSDSIPVHLVTREAMELYVSRLAPGGVLLVNLSNWYLDLVPVLGRLAHEVSLHGFVRADRDITRDEWAAGRFPSEWAVFALDASRLATLAADGRWRGLDRGAGRVWTDDYANVLAAFRWRR